MAQSEGLETRARISLDSGRRNEAFGYIRSAFADDVSRFVRLRIEDPGAREDVTQEIWAAASRALAWYRQDASLRTWLLAIAYRKVADHYRGLARRPRLTVVLSGDQLVGSLLEHQTGVSSKLRKHRRAAIVRRALGSLSVADQELLHMRYVDELPPREIAAVLGDGIKSNTVSQRIVAAVRRMRRLLEADQELDR